MYKTRRALKSLQYSPKGQDIAGVPSKIENLKVSFTQVPQFNY